MQQETEDHANALIGSLGSADAATWQEIGSKLSAAASSPEARAALVQGSRGLDQPSQGTRNWLWAVVVGAFAFVLVASVMAIIVGVFVGARSNPVVKSDLLLSIFTATVGFLAGLFVPPPGKE